jgi:hypothetical protein
MHILPCSVSDHKPIKLELLAHKDLGPIPFRFSPLWVKEADFMQRSRTVGSSQSRAPLFLFGRKNSEE